MILVVRVVYSYVLVVYSSICAGSDPSGRGTFGVAEFKPFRMCDADISMPFYAVAG
jgi:hypothetical protein